MEYLSNREILEALSAKKEWESVNGTVRENLIHEFSLDFSNEVNLALENGLKVYLIFGDKDYVCNVQGGIALADSFQWYGQAEYKKQTFIKWILNKVEVGKYKKYKNLGLFVIYNAGHSAFMKQREFVQQIFKSMLDS